MDSRIFLCKREKASYGKLLNDRFFCNGKGTNVSDTTPTFSWYVVFTSQVLKTKETSKVLDSRNVSFLTKSAKLLARIRYVKQPVNKPVSSYLNSFCRLSDLSSGYFIYRVWKSLKQCLIGKPKIFRSDSALQTQIPFLLCLLYQCIYSWYATPNFY